MIYLSPPDVGALEREYLNAALDSNWVAPAGPDLAAFEAAAAARVGVAAAVAVSSGTAALHLALLRLGVVPGDDVVVPSFTFVASANAAIYSGARPVFIDCDETTWGLSPDLVAEELDHRARHGRLPRVAIVVDLFGQCADYDRLLPVFAEYSIPVVEDAAEALGATYGGRPAGSFGACSILSFNGNKIITTGGGGMLLSDDADLVERARYLATQAREDTPHYEHVAIGYNYRLSNILAALGRAQLATLDERIARRTTINRKYREALSGCPGVTFMPVPERSRPNWWLTCIVVDPEAAGVTSDDLRVDLESHEIEARPLWKPMHLQPIFAEAPAVVDGTSERLFARGLCLPSGSGMSADDQDRVIERLRTVLG